MKRILFALTLGLLYVPISSAEIHITVNATLINPACTVTDGKGAKELFVDFQNVDVNAVVKTPPKNFDVLIKDCNLNKMMNLYLSPKDNGYFSYNGIDVLATTTDQLGIEFSDITSGKRKINVQRYERITPILSGSNSGKISLSTQLVANKPGTQLKMGPFTANVSLLVDYN
ncbi:fimbrial protein [Proteus hauseri]|uniref:fimbrial protein n=1 Tax=Proteus hauseri TaxID=183417 RepID=UPI0032DAE0C7